MPKRIIVVGSEIIGASIAWNLAKRGAEVTVVDAGERGGVATRIRGRGSMPAGEIRNLISGSGTRDARVAADRQRGS